MEVNRLDFSGMFVSLHSALGEPVNINGCQKTQVLSSSFSDMVFDFVLKTFQICV